jgi:hypothetical protein
MKIIVIASIEDALLQDACTRARIAELEGARIAYHGDPRSFPSFQGQGWVQKCEMRMHILLKYITYSADLPIPLPGNRAIDQPILWYYDLLLA